MKYKKSPLAICMKQSEDNYILGLGTQQSIVNKDEFHDVSRVLSFLQSERNSIEVEKFLNENDISYDLFSGLISKKMVTTWDSLFHKEDHIEYKNKLYLESVFSNGPSIIKNIKDMTFIIIGCGGIGNFISYSLASYMPKKIVLIDGDTIEKSNLNRQFLFSLHDIGEYKTDVLERELKARNGDINIVNKREYATPEILEEVLSQEKSSEVFIILSGDSDGIVEEVTRIAVGSEVSFLNIGYLNDISIIGPFYIPHVSSCPLCTDIAIGDDKVDNEEIKEFNKSYSAPSSFVNNSIASSMATMDILHYLSGNVEKINSLNKRLGLSNSNFEKLHLDVIKNDGCVICGTKQTVTVK